MREDRRAQKEAGSLTEDGASVCMQLIQERSKPLHRGGWRKMCETQFASLPRSGLRGRWDALRYALGIDKELRLERHPIKVSLYMRDPQVKVKVEEAGS